MIRQVCFLREWWHRGVVSAKSLSFIVDLKFRENWLHRNPINANDRAEALHLPQTTQSLIHVNRSQQRFRVRYQDNVLGGKTSPLNKAFTDIN